MRQRCKNFVVFPLFFALAPIKMKMQNTYLKLASCFVFSGHDKKEKKNFRKRLSKYSISCLQVNLLREIEIYIYIYIIYIYIYIQYTVLV